MLEPLLILREMLKNNQEELDIIIRTPFMLIYRRDIEQYFNGSSSSTFTQKLSNFLSLGTPEG